MALTVRAHSAMVVFLSSFFIFAWEREGTLGSGSSDSLILILVLFSAMRSTGSINSASSETVLYPLMVLRASTLYGLPRFGLNLAVTPDQSCVEEPRSLLFHCPAPLMLGMNLARPTADAVAFLTTVSTCFPKERRVSRMTPKYLSAIDTPHMLSQGGL